MLTPTYNRDRYYEFCCNSGEDYDQLLEHEQRLSSHPQHGHQREVVYEDGHCDTTSIQSDYILSTQAH